MHGLICQIKRFAEVYWHMWYLLFIPLLLISSLVSAEDRYSVRVDGELRKVRVKACFDGRAPPQLHRHEKSARFTDWIRVSGHELNPTGSGTRVRLPTMDSNECVEWQVDLAAAVNSGERRFALESEGVLLSDANIWFWRDDERREIRVRVELPVGFSISTPWKPLPAQPGQQNFRVVPTPASWSSRIAVGKFKVHRIQAGGAELRLAVIGQIRAGRDELFRQWIQDAARSVSSVSGRFPQPDAQVLVVPAGPQREPVPWAHVLRGGGAAAEFYVDQTRSLDELSHDWTATHEFSHMLLPYVSSRDRWLSEGLASYYQNVLRARDGRLTEQEAWRKLESGFERGRRATRSGSLAQATRSGWGSIMRVYWSGAAMMLKADSRLRALSGGSQSLDTALKSLATCCMETGRSWRAQDLLEELDRLTGYTVFSELYDSHVPDDQFPDLAQIYAQLGIVPGRGSITIEQNAPWENIRISIMRG
jgi:predicted metalloprotease with PDZ domain